MVEIAPFRGIRYNLKRIVDPSEVVAPPYDVITKEEQDLLYAENPYNIVRLILAREEQGKDRYTIAGETFRRWMKEGILVRDEKPAIYPYYQTYRVGGVEKTRKGFIALLRLEDFGSGKVLPHERTLPRPKEDRLKLMEACKANLCPVFGLYSDPEKGVEGVLKDALIDPPLIEVVDKEGVSNRFWMLSDEERIGRIRKILEDKFILIADGHHRYETALTYRDIMRRRYGTTRGEEPFNFVMIYLSNIDDEGFTILPTHRLLHGVPEEAVGAFLDKAGELFLIEDFSFDGSTEEEVRESFYERLEERGLEGAAIGLVIQGIQTYFLLIPKGAQVIDPLMEGIPREMRSLDIAILHEVVIKSLLGIDEKALEGQRHIEYVKDRDRAMDLVKEGRYQMAFILNPPRIIDIIRVVKTGRRMPQKSTYFYPKLLSGLVIHSFM